MMNRARWSEVARVVLVSGFIMVLVCSSACGKKRRPVQPPAPPPSVYIPPPGSSDLEGVASFYGEPHNGRPTANGEIFDKHAMTAAHRTLPFNTRVRVHDLDNRNSVDVRINDRGPFVAGRIIDLSEEAARRLGMIGPGTARVRLEILSSPAVDSGVFAVQVGAFSERRNADQLVKDLSRRYDHVIVMTYDSGNGILYRVRVGAETSMERANVLASRLRGERLPAMVVRND